MRAQALAHLGTTGDAGDHQGRAGRPRVMVGTAARFLDHLLRVPPASHPRLPGKLLNKK
ncbi:hypothetical protein D9M68_431160 [compost metagenome]